MDFLSALKISGSGLAAERTRVNLAASNLANAETTRGPDGKPYRRLDPVMESVPFEAALGQADQAAGAAPAGVRVARVAADPTPGKRVYSPSHPDADPQGFVTLPNVNPIHEVVNLMSASRTYDANATAIDTLKTMAQRALDITR
ncbi:flagellar basal body rod protein FlgC [Anaeromyxobacter paludicola]|uniref:Flagellar basal-body rod protein FlgC n=1 Tax=Anaeromyxobacter paludicola TaxID=2918171 RepID=A0ABM7X806_9BACT|nr:flagellar basal body rod protein FlgC [Anaeromyxobacter paludicola]BDG07966.1 flagellar basal-body rod protein FlgC [Anaeromyxobacter paludicola]